MKPRLSTLVLALLGLSLPAWAQTYLQGNPQATVRGGASANLDIIEGTPTGTAGVPSAQLGTVTVKFAGAPFDSARKHYVKIDLTGQNPNTNGPLYVQYTGVSASGAQTVQLWSLDQDYPGFNANLTWNTAQANDTTSGSGMITGGGFTATPYQRFNSAGGAATTSHTLHGGPWGQLIRSGNNLYLVFTSVVDVNSNGARWRTNGAGGQDVYIGFEPITTGTPPALGVITNNLAPNGQLTVVQGFYSTATNYFSVADPETTITSLAVTPTSSSEVNLPSANVFVEGTGSTRSVYVLAPPTAASGTYTVVLALVDGDGNRATRAFDVVLQQFNLPPVIVVGNSTNALPVTNTHVNTAVTLPFLVADPESPQSSLTVTASIAPYSVGLLASADLTGTDYNTNLTLTVTPQPDVDGVGVVRITCSDTNGNLNTRSICVMVRLNDAVAFVDHFDYNGTNTKLTDDAPSFWTRRNASPQSVFFRSGTDPASGNKVAWIRPNSGAEDVAASLVGGPYNAGSRAVLYTKFNATFADQAASGPGNNIITNSDPGAAFFRLSPAAASTTDFVNYILVTTNTATDPETQFRLAVGNGTGASLSAFPADFSKPVNLAAETGPFTLVTRYDVEKAQTHLWVNASSEADANVAGTDPQVPVTVGFVGLFQARGYGDIYIDDLTVIVKIKPLIILVGAPAGSSIDLDFTAGTTDVPADFQVERAAAVTGPYATVAASISALSGGNFRATVGAPDAAGFYKVKRKPVSF